MANLKLKWGSYSALPQTVAADDIGAIFVTKDEGGIYLGVESGKAPKRLQGVVQYYEDLTSFQAATKPPYSSDVIYYIANSNALVRWDSTAKDGAGGFIVLNVTANEFAALNDQVQNHLTEIESKQVFDKVAKIDGLEDAIEAIEELIGGGSSGEGVTSIIAQIDELGKNQAAINKDLEEISQTLVEVEATYETKLNAQTERQKLSDRIDLIDGENGTVKKLTDRVTALDKTGGRIALIEQELSNKVNLAHLESNYQTQSKAAQDHKALSDRIDLIDGTDGTVKNLADRVTELDKDGGRVAAVENALLNKVDLAQLESNYQTKAQAKLDHDAIGERIDLIDGEEGTIKKLTDRVTALDKTDGRIDVIEDALLNKVDLSHLETLYWTKAQAVVQAANINKRIDAIDNAETGALKTITDRIDLIDGETGRLKTIEDNLGLKLDKVTFENLWKTAYTKSEAEALESTLREELADNIETANCLTYQGSIEDEDDFNALDAKTDLQVGYTYIITTELTLPSIGVCYAGDLIIASGEEENGVLSDINWIHVKTGYQSSHNTVLSAESGNENKAKINLTSLNGEGEKGDCGSVSIYGENNMIISQLTKTTTSEEGETIITPIPEFKFSL